MQFGYIAISRLTIIRKHQLRAPEMIVCTWKFIKSISHLNPRLLLYTVRAIGATVRGEGEPLALPPLSLILWSFAKLYKRRGWQRPNKSGNCQD